MSWKPGSSLALENGVEKGVVVWFGLLFAVVGLHESVLSGSPFLTFGGFNLYRAFPYGI